MTFTPNGFIEMAKATAVTPPPPGHDDVRRLCGDLLDWKIAAILRTGATLEEIEEAVAWSVGESDVMAAARKPLSGRVSDIYDILAAAEEEPDDRG